MVFILNVYQKTKIKVILALFHKYNSTPSTPHLKHSPDHRQLMVAYLKVLQAPFVLADACNDYPPM